MDDLDNSGHSQCELRYRFGVGRVGGDELLGAYDDDNTGVFLQRAACNYYETTASYEIGGYSCFK